MKKNNSSVKNYSKWNIDYKSLDQPKNKNIVNPIGYSNISNKHNLKSKQKEVPPSNTQLKNKKAWEIALAGAKSIPMNAIMLYMSGSGIQIFSIVITFMLLFNPIKDIMNVNNVFNKLKGDDQISANFVSQKIAYLMINIIMMGMGLWKCSSMGLLPTSSSDWLAFEPPRQFREILLH